MTPPVHRLGGRVKRHLQYASYVARHKWFVFRAGLKTAAPIWRLLIHDWSKLTPAEWGPYVEMFYGDPIPDVAYSGEAGERHRRQQAFDAAWLHHQHRNPHHWQHWLLREDDGLTKALKMPDGLVREMVADWMGAGRAITGKWDVASWYDANRHKLILADDVRIQVETLIAVHGSGVGR
jgi:hypothetical protein